MTEPQWVWVHPPDGEMAMIACCPRCWHRTVEEDGEVTEHATQLDLVNDQWTCSKCEGTYRYSKEV